MSRSGSFCFSFLTLKVKMGTHARVGALFETIAVVSNNALIRVYLALTKCLVGGSIPAVP